MKFINLILGFLIIFLGCTLMNITIFNEEFKTVGIKIGGFLIVVAGVFYLIRIMRFGKQ